MTKEQSGFRPHHSTQTALLYVTDYILSNMNEGYVTGAIFVDLKKAFDTVDHDILLEKLHDADIRDHELEWFKSYLKNRAQATKIDEHMSSFAPIIPLGSHRARYLDL